METPVWPETEEVTETTTDDAMRGWLVGLTAISLVAAILFFAFDRNVPGFAFIVTFIVGLICVAVVCMYEND